MLYSSSGPQDIGNYFKAPPKGLGGKSEPGVSKAFQRLPYAQASAVPFFEPYVATKDSLEELMVKKREGAKELDGNMASIKKAQAVLEEQLAANNREQVRLEQRYAFLELNVE